MAPDFRTGTSSDSKYPLLLLLLNLLLVAICGICGGIGMLLAGEWKVLLLGILMGMAYPPVLMALHWLKWLIDIPAMLAGDAKWRVVTALLVYLSGFFISTLLLGWVTLVLWSLGVREPAWAVLAWGYALASAPLLVVVLRPAGYPLLVLLVLVAQFLYPAAWSMLHLAGLGMDKIIQAIAVLAALVPLVQFWSRWQSATRPD